MQSITRRHIIHFACGCTTTRIEVGSVPTETVPVCTGHSASAIKEEHIVDFQGQVIEVIPAYHSDQGEPKEE